MTTIQTVLGTISLPDGTYIFPVEGFALVVLKGEQVVRTRETRADGSSFFVTKLIRADGTELWVSAEEEES